MLKPDRQPLFSVVIPTCRRAEALARCLHSLAPGRQWLPWEYYEVRVSDDSPDSHSRELIEGQFPWAIWLEGPRRGPAANRNAGARQARGQWLVFVDDDCEPDPGWLQALAEATQAGRVDVLEGRTLCPDGRDHPLLEQVENLHGGVYWSCNLALPRAVLEGLGGFDQDFAEPGGEDMELAWRIRQAGLSCRFVPQALVLHPARRVGWRGIWRRTLLTRWMLLYRLKTHQAPPLHAHPWRVCRWLLVQQTVELVRTTGQLLTRPDGCRWRTRLFWQGWRWFTFPLLLPYLVFWEFRFRRILAQRPSPAAAPIASVPSSA